MEVWKDIKGFEGLYQVSNLGNIKHLPYSQPYIGRWGNLVIRKKKELMLKPAPMKRSNGYLGVTLYKNGKRCTRSVHRLVAEAFVPNPNNLPQVNHKDENKLNNESVNLEWCTSQYNINYGTANHRRSRTMRFKQREVYENE